VKHLAENNTADNVKEGISNIGPTIRSYFRILKLARKPTRKEFLTIAKVAAAGIIAIGIIGFLFYVMMDVVPQYIIPIRNV
jgi:protein translocase SEC61 complex gamma subunit, archaeal and eukaryotic